MQVTQVFGPGFIDTVNQLLRSGVVSRAAAIAGLTFAVPCQSAAILSSVLDLDIEGIVLKQGAPTDLPKALAALQKGKKYTPESVARLLEKISAGGYGDKRLSPKESEVLRLFAEGFLVTEIARKLNRSIKTISSQKKSAMMKLGVDNDIALLNYLSSVSASLPKD